MEIKIFTDEPHSEETLAEFEARLAKDPALKMQVSETLETLTATCHQIESNITERDIAVVKDAAYFRQKLQTLGAEKEIDSAQHLDLLSKFSKSE
jgi:hypothetical protein